MRVLPVRLSPGDDLRRALEAAVQGEGSVAACVLSGIGSLGAAAIRHAGVERAAVRVADFEILTLAGMIGAGRSHLHATIADAQGAVSGGHVAYGCVVRTTAEVVLGLADGWIFDRAHDDATGYEELVVRRAPDAEA